MPKYFHIRTNLDVSSPEAQALLERMDNYLEARLEAYKKDVVKQEYTFGPALSASILAAAAGISAVLSMKVAFKRIVGNENDPITNMLDDSAHQYLFMLHAHVEERFGQNDERKKEVEGYVRRHVEEIAQAGEMIAKMFVEGMTALGLKPDNDNEPSLSVSVATHKPTLH